MAGISDRIGVPMQQRRAIQIVDLAFGDCGKGTIVDYLARRLQPAVVVRFNGGPQAGHNVVTPDGRHHTFSQFGSGTFVPGVRTFLSRFMLIEPYSLLNEARHLNALGLRNPLQQLTVDTRCPVITPAHQAANRIRELARGDAAHGTCGMGVGELMQDLAEHPDIILRAGDLGDRRKVRARLLSACELKSAQLRPTFSHLNAFPATAMDALQAARCTLTDPSWVDAAVDNFAEVAHHVVLADGDELRRLCQSTPTVLFEGAQGVLLDERFGFHPHTTWSSTTFANADALLNETGLDIDRKRLGVLRTYLTRHGAGPFVTEDPTLNAHLPEHHNNAAGWQGRFRVGRFDAVAARYAIACAGGVDALAITHLDALLKLDGQVCEAYREDAADPAPSSPDRHFAGDGTQITAIRVPQQPDLDQQAALTRRLLACRPVLRPWPTGDIPFRSRLADELATPIAITSFGPTFADKAIHDPVWSFNPDRPHQHARK